MNVNVNLIEQNAVQINGGITINVDASVKIIIYVKKDMLGILVHVIVNMENIQQVLWMTQLEVQRKTMIKQKPFKEILMKRK